MPKHGKKYKATRETVEQRPYGVDEALEKLAQIAWAGFDETVEIALLLGVDPRHADQMVRGTVVLPHGTGRSKRVLAIAGGEKYKEAEQAGADVVMTGPEAVEKISAGFLEFDAVVATPDVMRDIGRLGKVLGPRGLMPNPKTGTVTMDIARAVEEIKAGKVEFRVNKTSIVHGVLGKKSFTSDQLRDNFRAFVGAIQRAKPAAAKGRYIKSVHVGTTMSPSLEIELGDLERAQAEQS
ncbi:MAG: 50S ribosomal protein L1 [Acidobacteriota bacterium]|nr:MAG: 50S ribosomal protein L1 [Acidobacteriota bacterium]